MLRAATGWQARYVLRVRDDDTFEVHAEYITESDAEASASALRSNGYRARVVDAATLAELQLAARKRTS